MKKLKFFIDENPLIVQRDFDHVEQDTFLKYQQEDAVSQNGPPLESNKNLNSQNNLQSGHELWQEFDSSNELTGYFLGFLRVGSRNAFLFIFINFSIVFIDFEQI